MRVEIEDVFATLETRGVMRDDREALTLTESFQETVADIDPETGIEQRSDTLTEAEISDLERISDLSPRAVAEYLALVDHCEDDFDEAARTWVVSVIDTFDPDPVEDEGAPENFTPIHGEKVPFLARFFEKSIVYFWRHDCDPCDLVRTDFEELLDESHEGIARFAVYGPSATELLREEYDVAAAPTVLFFYNGRVDVRLIGAKPPQALMAEVEHLRDL